MAGVGFVDDGALKPPPPPSPRGAAEPLAIPLGRGLACLRGSAGAKEEIFEGR